MSKEQKDKAITDPTREEQKPPKLFVKPMPYKCAAKYDATNGKASAAANEVLKNPTRCHHGTYTEGGACGSCIHSGLVGKPHVKDSRGYVQARDELKQCYEASGKISTDSKFLRSRFFAARALKHKMAEHSYDDPAALAELQKKEMWNLQKQLANRGEEVFSIDQRVHDIQIRSSAEWP